MCKFPMPSSHFALQITATRKIPKIHTYYKCQFHACVSEKICLQIPAIIYGKEVALLNELSC